MSTKQSTNDDKTVDKLGEVSTQDILNCRQALDDVPVPTEGRQLRAEYPALLYALADPVKREKLRRISESLRNHGVLKDVSYGIGGPTFDVVSEYLAVLT